MRTTDAAALVESVLHGRRAPSLRAVDALRRDTVPIDPAGWDVDDRVRAAARLTALSRLGQTDAAAALALAWREVPMPPPDADLPAVTVLGLSSAIVEAEICAGRASAVRLAERMLSHALDVGDPEWILRARGLSAAASALGGDDEAATARLREIRGDGLPDEEVVDYMAEVGEAVLAFTALDADRLARTAGRLHRLQESEPHAGALAQLVDAAAAALTGDRHRMTALTSRLVQASGDGAVPRQALWLQAFTLVRGEEPLRAIGLLREEEPDEEHLHCPAMLRAAAHLRLGDPRSTLGATTECVRLRPRHNLHTLASVLILRGVAHLRLQMVSLGHREIDEAFAMLGSSIPAATVSLLHAIDQRMLRVVAGREGRVPAATLDALRASESDSVDAHPFPILTPREHAVAEQLRLPRTFADIAASLHVAPSTVKTQALSIYRKLRVSTRDDAVGFLEQAGYFEQ